MCQYQLSSIKQLAMSGAQSDQLFLTNTTSLEKKQDTYLTAIQISLFLNSGLFSLTSS